MQPIKVRLPTKWRDREGAVERFGEQMKKSKQNYDSNNGKVQNQAEEFRHSEVRWRRKRRVQRKQMGRWWERGDRGISISSHPESALGISLFISFLLFWLLSILSPFLCLEIFVFTLFVSLGGRLASTTEVKSFRLSLPSQSPFETRM